MVRKQLLEKQIQESISAAVESGPDSCEHSVLKPDSTAPFARSALKSGVPRGLGQGKQAVLMNLVPLDQK